MVATAVAAKASGAMLVQTNQSLYSNDLYGINLSKPESWNFISITKYAELANTIEHKMSTEELEVIFEKYYEYPLVVMSPELDIVPDFQPMIYVHAEVLDLDEFTFDLFHECTQRFHEDVLKDFKITHDFETKTTHGLPSSYHAANFSQQIKGQPKVEARYKTLVLQQGHLGFTINSIDSPKNGINTDSEFDAFISSLDLARTPPTNMGDSSTELAPWSRHDALETPKKS